MAGSTSQLTRYDSSAYAEPDGGAEGKGVRLTPSVPPLSDLTALLELHGWQEVTS